MKIKLDCVLLIDDDNMSSFMNKSIIDEAEVTNGIVREFSGRSGLMYLSDSMRTNGFLPFPSLIFLDLFMPNGDGWAFMEEFNNRKNGFPFEPIVILLTSDKRPETTIRANHYHISEVCDKPLTGQKIRTILAFYFPLLH